MCADFTEKRLHEPPCIIFTAVHTPRSTEVMYTPWCNPSKLRILTRKTKQNILPNQRICNDTWKKYTMQLAQSTRARCYTRRPMCTYCFLRNSVNASPHARQLYATSSSFHGAGLDGLAGPDRSTTLMRRPLRTQTARIGSKLFRKRYRWVPKFLPYGVHALKGLVFCRACHSG